MAFSPTSHEKGKWKAGPYMQKAKYGMLRLHLLADGGKEGWNWFMVGLLGKGLCNLWGTTGDGEACTSTRVP